MEGGIYINWQWPCPETRSRVLGAPRALPPTALRPLEEPAASQWCPATCRTFNSKNLHQLNKMSRRISKTVAVHRCLSPSAPPQRLQADQLWPRSDLDHLHRAGAGIPYSTCHWEINISGPGWTKPRPGYGFPRELSAMGLLLPASWSPFSRGASRLFIDIAVTPALPLPQAACARKLWEY